VLLFHCGPGKHSQFSEALQAGWSGDQIPVGGLFSAPVQTSHGAHPASYMMGTGSFPGVKRPGHFVDHPYPSRLEIRAILHLPLWAFMICSRVNFTCCKMLLRVSALQLKIMDMKINQVLLRIRDGEYEYYFDVILTMHRR